MTDTLKEHLRIEQRRMAETHINEAMLSLRAAAHCADFAGDDHLTAIVKAGMSTLNLRRQS